MKYAVFTDIDDTLYYDMKMNPKNVEAIKAARKNGHLVFINTGRSTGIIYRELMGGLFDGIVASVGGEVYVGEKTLLKETIPIDDVVMFGEEFLKEGRVFVFEATADSPLRAVKNTDKNVISLLKNSGCEFSKLYIEGDISLKGAERIREKYQLFIHSWYFEFTTKGCTKATGMKKVLDYFGIPKENCIAIGDSVNDIDMLSAAGIPVCVENAVDELKKISVYQTCHARDGALFDCFKKFGLI